LAASALLAGLSTLLISAAPATEWEKLYQSASDNWDAGKCRPAIADSERLKQTVGKQAALTAQNGPELTSFANAVIVSCHYKLNEPERGRDAARAALRQEPADLNLAKNWLHSALRQAQLDDALEAMTAAVSGTPGDISASISPDTLYYLLRELRKAGRQKDATALEIRLAQSGYGGDFYEIRDDLRLTAVRAAMESGDMVTAQAMSAGIVNPLALDKLLTQAQYKPLWSQLEKQAGPGKSLANAQALTGARRHAHELGAAEESDEAAGAQARLMDALWHSNQRMEALAVGAKAYASPAVLAAANEAGGWLIDSHAALLAADGQVDAAIARYDSLVDLAISERPWLVSMRINRSTMLLSQGRFDQLLAGVDALEADAKAYGNIYAQQLVRQLRMCALAGVGRLAEAEALKPELLKKATEAPYVTMRGLRCVGDEDNAARLMTAALRDPDKRNGAIIWLQPASSVDDPKAPTLRPLLARPDVAAAYAEVARDLPEALR
jgi:hypothetical protein